MSSAAPVVAERGSYRLVRRPTAPAAPRRDDPLQRRVIGHTAGPLLVVGAPGTGKTATLVEAVAARVAEGVDPERLLVLTFGRRGAARLRRRIGLRLGVSGDVPSTRPRPGSTTDRPEPGSTADRFEPGSTAGVAPGSIATPVAGPAVPPAAVPTAEPMVRTFHGYAFGLLRRAAIAAGDPAPRLLTGPEQDAVIRELLAYDDGTARWPEDLLAALTTRAFAEQLRDLMLRAAERGVGAGGLDRLGAAVRRAEWRSAARFIRQYEQVLTLRDATGRAGISYDHAELVRAAVALLDADPDLLAAERSRLRHVYVDELADTDPAQLDLLAAIAGGGRHLVAFGDPDSSTFAFRGADPRGLATFPDRFTTLTGAPAPVITLDRAYRSGADLVAATRRIAARLSGPPRHRAITAVDGLPAGQVDIATLRTTGGAAGYAAHTLRAAHLIDGVPWHRMAVIVRSTALQLPGLQRALHQAGVPTVTVGEDIPLAAAPAVAPLLLLLRCAVEPRRLDEAAAVTLLHSPLGGADPLAERRLRQGLRALALAAGDRRPSGVLLVEALRDPTELAAVERRWAAPARAVAALLGTARQAAARAGATAEDVLWQVWQASGLAPRWAQASARGGVRGAAADRDLDAVVALFEVAARFTDRLPGAGVAVFLDHLLGQEIPGDPVAPVGDRGEAVTVLTAHAAKGLEWDVVVVAGVQEGLWPDLRPRGSVLGSEHLVDLVAGRAGGDVAALADPAAGGPATATGGPVTGISTAAILAGQAAALLEEERRLFYVAVTRASRRLVVTAVASGDGEEQPSRFLDELAGRDPAAEETADVVDRMPRALTLAALVAELRSALADPASPPVRRAGAAAQLARLAEAGVPGAHPDDWWGLRPLSDERPLVDDGDTVVVTPSTVDSVSRCSLRWLLEKHGGGNPTTAEQGVGNLVHAAAMLAADAAVDRATLIRYVAERFDEIELSARWLAGRERERAGKMIDKLISWLATNPRRVAAIEREFLVQLSQDVAVRGQVDRLEIDDAGRLVVIDIKTGRSTAVTEAEIGEHGQLGAYQAAVEAGAFAELGTESGGAALVQLGTAAAGVREQVQPPLSDAEDPGWAATMVRGTAATMAAATFHARTNSACRTCPVRTSCPVSGRGRHITEPR